MIFKMASLRFMALNFSNILNSKFIGSKFQPSTLGYKKVSALRGFLTSKTLSTKPCYNDGDLTITCLKQLLNEHDVQLFDVRTREEVKAGQIPGAVNIPIDELQEAFSLSPTEFKRKYSVPKPGLKDDNITFHCRTGKRAQEAVEILRGMGFERAHNFTGGWEEWQKSTEDKSTK